MPNDAARQNPHHEHIALVLQGGGALGAYQAGVYEEIAKIPKEPHWVAGISIGAINAALIAGNPPELRVARLREFWHMVSSRFSSLAPQIDLQRSAFHQFSAGVSAVMGVNGFYRPRLIPPVLQPEGTDAAISIYDTAPLRATLERLVDFNLINRKMVRLSVGAVNVRTGNSIFFDNWRQEIGPEHIMASGALPPAFAPVEIEGELYWDGGIVSNTPLQYVLDNRPQKGRLMIAQVDLFNARGEAPTTLGAALIRQKDIIYSSRTRFNTDQAARMERHKSDLRALIARLPPEFQDDPEVLRLKASCRQGHIDIVHLIYRQNEFELESKDYEFSRATVEIHWQAGKDDMAATTAHPDWLTKSESDSGITIYDLARDRHRITETPPGSPP